MMGLKTAQSPRKDKNDNYSVWEKCEECQSLWFYAQQHNSMWTYSAMMPVSRANIWGFSIFDTVFIQNLQVMT